MDRDRLDKGSRTAVLGFYGLFELIGRDFGHVTGVSICVDNRRDCAPLSQDY